MLLLQISDLHFGTHSRFQAEDLTILAQRVGQSIENALTALSINERIDVVLVTGDIAETGVPKQFAQGSTFLVSLAASLGVNKYRFVFIPGNHDVCWNQTISAEQHCLEHEIREESEQRKRIDEVKFTNYYAFLNEFYDVPLLTALPGCKSLGNDAYLHVFEDLGIAIAALNSCERESHRKADHIGFVSIVQATAVMQSLLALDRSLIKLLLVHHNPDIAVTAAISDWQESLAQQTSLDSATIERYVADLVGLAGRDHLVALAKDCNVQLLLHGHQHGSAERTWPWNVNGSTHVLAAGSFGLQQQKLPGDEPCAMRLIQINRAGSHFTSHVLVYDGRVRLDGTLFKGAFVPDPSRKPYTHRLEGLPPVADVVVTDVSKNSTGETTPDKVILGQIDPERPYFYCPFQAKGSLVIGREGRLRDLRELLTSGDSRRGRAVAIQGIGGLGKTQLAIEYAYERKADYPGGVYWMAADKQLAPQLSQLAIDAGWIAPSSEHSYRVDVARNRLTQSSNALIIFDNVEDGLEVRPFMPVAQSNSHVLITSQLEIPGVTPLAMATLTTSEALELLCQESGRTADDEVSRSAAIRIVHRLDRHPLAIELAGTFLQRRSAISWPEYAGALESNLKTSLREHLLASHTRHHADLYVTLKVNQHILDNEPLLLPTLDVLAWSGFASMGTQLLSKMLGMSEVDLQVPLSAAVALRLVEQEHLAGSRKRVRLHRLIMEVWREERPLAELRPWVDSTCLRLADWFTEQRQNFADLPTFEAELEHLHSWLGHAVTFAPHHAPRLTWLKAYPPYHRGQPAQSKAFLIKALEALDGLGT